MTRAWALAALAGVAATPSIAWAQPSFMPPGYIAPGWPGPNVGVGRQVIIAGTINANTAFFSGGRRISATPEAIRWAASEVKAQDGWVVLEHDDRGVVLIKPSGGLDAERRVRAHIRAEYREPVTVGAGVLRSVQGDMLLSCEIGTAQPTKVTAYQGQNLTGPSWLVPATYYEDKVRKVSGSIVFKILTPANIYDLCASGDVASAARAGPDWRGLVPGPQIARLVKGQQAMSPDLKMKVSFRIESERPEQEDERHPRWRSALVEGDLDCGNGIYRLTATAYAKPNLEGASFPLENARFPATDAPAPGQPGGTAPPPPPAVSLLRTMGGGSFFMRPCHIAMSRLSEQLLLEDSPERRRAQAWASAAFKTTGWRMPTYIPQGVMLLGEEITPRPTGERLAQVRQEFVGPLRNDKGEMVSSRISVVDVDCTGKRVRVVGIFEYAKNNAKDLVKEERAYSAPWSPLEEMPGLTAYFSPVCGSG